MKHGVWSELQIGFGLHIAKVGHLQPVYICLSRLGCSLGELQDVWPDKFCQAKHFNDKKICIYLLTVYGITHDIISHVYTRY